MELMSILNENNHSFFNPVDLTYEYVRKTEDEVVFSIYTIEDYKKIGEYRFWGNVSLDTVYIWNENWKAPNKEYLLKLIGMLPVVVKAYIDNNLFNDGENMPYELKFEPETKIMKKLVFSDEYHWFANSKRHQHYRSYKDGDKFLFKRY
jgi:hypothetical protein